jgi:hypothetical protein
LSTKFRGIFWSSIFIIVLLPLLAASDQLIKTVSLSSDHFNPTAGQRLTISIALTKPGKLTLQIVDRDGYVVRTLAADSDITAGEQRYEWLGDTDTPPNEIVPDEAYSLRILAMSGKSIETYFPANKIVKELKPKLNYYDRKRGIVSYSLEAAGRVHVQAGVAHVLDQNKKLIEGCVMKTIVNRSPRGSGNVAEFWDGFADGDKTIYIPDLPNFKIAIAATELPENSIITVGSKGKSFADSVVNRQGKSLFTFKTQTHEHHQGLSTLDDLSPELTIDLKNAEWDEVQGIWVAQNPFLMVHGMLRGPNAEAFSRQFGRLLVFLGEKRVIDVSKPLKTSFDLEVPLNEVSSGIHILTLNSVSQNGPVGVHAIRVRVDKNPQSVNSNAQGKNK